MRVVIYARYSTDMQDAASITGQVANCEAIADANGWQVVDHYSDEAISGSDDARPSYQRLLADSEAAKFDGIIVDETSRLTRRPGELPRLLELFGFRDQFLVDCKGFDSRQETSSLLASIYGGIDSLEIRKIKARTHRGLQERAKEGFSAGGRSYGYTSVPVDPRDPGTRWRKVIDEDQAAIVREIFTMYAGGMSSLAIAKELNRRGVPSPGATWNRKGGKTSDGKWRVSAIYGDMKRGTGILCNELYRGQYVWNRTEWRKVPGSKKRKCIPRPESEWKRRDMPELRIIDDALWSRVQIRIRETQRKTEDLRVRHPGASGGRKSRYLLSGLMACAECGGNFIMADTRAYQCSTHKAGGEHACRNGIRVKRETAESVILADIETEMLSDQSIEFFRKETARIIRERKQARARSRSDTKTRDELAKVDRQLSNLVDFIAERGHDGSIKAKLDSLEARRDELRARLEAPTDDMDRIPDLIPGLLTRYRDSIVRLARIADDGSVTQVARARSLLRALLGQIPLYPDYAGGYLTAGMSMKTKALALVSEDAKAFALNTGSGGALRTLEAERKIKLVA